MCFTGDEMRAGFGRVLVCFNLHGLFIAFTETDDYAEIIDEEDTYTMPSSEYLCLISH